MASASGLPGKICSSSGNLTNQYVEFGCPKCNDSTIIRCDECRKTYTRYRCPKCAFEGP